jgi:hypothetical protein
MGMDRTNIESTTHRLMDDYPSVEAFGQALLADSELRKQHEAEIIDYMRADYARAAAKKTEREDRIANRIVSEINQTLVQCTGGLIVVASIVAGLIVGAAV